MKIIIKERGKLIFFLKKRKSTRLIFNMFTIFFDFPLHNISFHWTFQKQNFSLSFPCWKYDERQTCLKIQFQKIITAAGWGAVIFVGFRFNVCIYKGVAPWNPGNYFKISNIISVKLKRVFEKSGMNEIKIINADLRFLYKQVIYFDYTGLWRSNYT